MTNRDYHNFDLYYQELLGDVYSQPSDEGHLKLMTEVINRWIIPLGVSLVFDAGAGSGDAYNIFKAHKIDYLGCALNEDFSVAGVNHVGPLDFNFATKEFGDEFFDLVLSRHSLEHSPFPIITLMDWYKVSKKWLALVVPNPEHYKYVGRNHYSVANIHQNVWWLRRAGWKLNKLNVTETEFWFLCEKKPRISYEGWAKAPIHHLLYEFERDLKDFKGEMDVAKYFADRKWNELF